ncbi:MAG TPA: caspase family protein [Kofleriaceae bacterium]|nr:caspase family protein [Kofleriaceae bacterium]
MSLLVLVAVAHSAHAEQRYAVLVGANPGWSSDRPLRYAEDDADRVRDVLVTLGGFSADHVSLLRDPDTNEVRATLRDLVRSTQGSSEATMVFFYYSGHADNERVHLRGDVLTFKEIRDTLRALPSTIKLAVIDACKSGAVVRKGGSRIDDFEVSVDNPKLSGMVLLTSSGADELSQESRALAGSVFTHHLVSGLRGAADANGDKQVTVAEAYHYAYARTRADTASTGTPQRPSFQYELSGQGELVLSQLKTAKTAKITLPKGNGDKYVVLDSHEMRLVAEARSEKDHEVELTLAPGSYHVKKVLSDKLEVAAIVLAAGEAASTSKIAYKDAPLAQGIVKGSAEDLSPDEQREWQRSQAFGLLAAGNPNAAITVFDTLLRANPGDLLSWRGRARALIRIAETYGAVNDYQREKLAMSEALKADPLLTQDPSFKSRYEKLAELDAKDQATLNARLAAEQAIRKNPRSVKHVGFGFDLLSARGMFTVDASLVVKRMIFPRVAIDVGSQGFDAGVVIAPYPSRWSPFLGIGGHVSWRKMGIPVGAHSDMINVNDNMYSTEEMWGLHGRAEAGAQYVGRSGFSTELGLALIAFREAGGRTVQQAWPIFHFGWVW